LKDLLFLHSSLDENKLNIPIILVEDDVALGGALTKYLEKSFSSEVLYFSRPKDCLEEMAQRTPYENNKFILITDISFENSNEDGLLLIDILKERGANFKSIVMTGFASIETAIQATKKGVFHYLTKPFDMSALQGLVQKAMGEMTSGEAKSEQTLSSKSKYKSSYGLEHYTDKDIFMGMIGRSLKMKAVFERVQKVADSSSTVLITGESGTGKELVANSLHQLSSRKNNMMVPVNCGAIPSELLESELFGHIKGAFTGAISDRKGRFELADSGAIFLDEIGDMPLLLQVKLLRVLQTKCIEKIGSNDTQNIDVRIIAATHRGLEKLVAEGEFREDLFYRLNVIPIRVPSLRERREDIPLLVSYFLSKFVSADGRNSISFHDDAMNILLDYSWPGNVRELENLIERLVILKGGSLINVSDLPAKFIEMSKTPSVGPLNIDMPEDGISLKETLCQIEDDLILQALEKTRGNKNQAAKLLKINRTTLIEKMKKKNLLIGNRSFL
jgi:two-component system, NtrC family, response regulator PilR